MKVEIQPSSVICSKDPSREYGRLHAKKTWEQIHQECGGIPITLETLSNSETRDAALAADDGRKKFIDEQEKINRHASGWPQG